jgi:predicted nucleotide-binding protein
MVTYIQEACRWYEYNLELLKRLFANPTIADQNKRERFLVLTSLSPGQASVTQITKFVIDIIFEDIDLLESLLGRLEFYPEALSQSVEGEATVPGDRSKVFVVHGHDEGAREGVARFLEKIGLEAILLREQPNRGRTVIEKFVDCAREVGFAVVLLTPDDLGGAASGDAQMSRARQNVIFELGYFVGSLGRGRACLLRRGDVEIPSDLYGVVYTHIDAADGWKIELARELKAAGFKFDAGKVLA